MLRPSNRVFRALASPARRELLDRLFLDGGQTLKELTADRPDSIFTVKRNLAILRAAGLVTIVRRPNRGSVHVAKAETIGDLYRMWLHKFIDRDRPEHGD